MACIPTYKKCSVNDISPTIFGRTWLRLKLDLPIYIFTTHINTETMKPLCGVVCMYSQLHSRGREIYCCISSRLLVGLLFLVAVSTNAVGFLYVASVKDRSDYVQSKASKCPTGQLNWVLENRLSWLTSFLISCFISESKLLGNKYITMNQEPTVSNVRNEEEQSSIIAIRKSQSNKFHNRAIEGRMHSLRIRRWQKIHLFSVELGGNLAFVLPVGLAFSDILTKIT
jgi:hypothetical protein